MSKKPKPQLVTPSLESITLRGKYGIPEAYFNSAREIISSIEPSFLCGMKGTSAVECINWGEDKAKRGIWLKRIKEIRIGLPAYFSLTKLEKVNNRILVEIECRPVMWYLISQYEEVTFTENQVQEALIECRLSVKHIMSGLEGKEIEPVSVYPIIPKAEIKSRLLNLGLEKVVSPLDKAEKHIVQNNFKESLKSSRTAFEKMIDWQMKKRGLGKTNSYTNNLERLKSKGYLDAETTKLLKTYYQCLSVIGVHEKGIEPGIFEAQMGYGITLIMLDYFANKLP